MLYTVVVSHTLLVYFPSLACAREESIAMRRLGLVS